MIEYHVDEKKRCVVAYLSGGKQSVFEALKGMGAYVLSDSLLFIDYEKLAYKTLKDSKISVRVTCHPNDQFDEAIGKKIAHDRLIAKLKRIENNYLKNLAHLIQAENKHVSHKIAKFLPQFDGRV